jgi:hypothetical protein
MPRNHYSMSLKNACRGCLRMEGDSERRTDRKITMKAAVILSISLSFLLCIGVSGKAEDTPTGEGKKPRFSANPIPKEEYSETGEDTRLRTGIFGKAPKLVEAHAKLAEYRAKAAAMVSERYGLTLPDGFRVILSIEDLGQERARKSGIMTAQKRHEGLGLTIAFFSEALLTGMADLEQEVVHEYNHAVMTAILGRE